MLKQFKKIRDTIKNKISKLHADSNIVRNVKLLTNNHRVRNNRLLKNVFEFIVKNDPEALAAVLTLLENDEVKVTHILAEDRNGCLGNNSCMEGSLVWDSPDDMKHFVAHTKNKVCIVGGTTFRGFGTAVLKNRKMIVVTKHKATIDRCKALQDHYAVSNVSEAYCLALKLAFADKATAREIMVIGGASIYRQTLPFVTDVLLSKINLDSEGNISRDWVYPKEVNVTEFHFEGVVKHG